MAVGDVIHYSSIDASAPVLTGEAGTLVNLLDKLLVNGYGSKPAQGWTKPFSGTNKAAYKQPIGTNGFYLRVDDNAVDSNKTAQVRGYETMTDVDTGTFLFPTVAQRANYYVAKSTTANSTARPWRAVGDGYTLFLMVEFNPGASFVDEMEISVFGDIDPWGASDVWGTLCKGRISTVTASANVIETMSPRSFSTVGYYARRFDGNVAGAANYRQASIDSGAGGSVNASSATVDDPSEIIGGNVIWPAFCIEQDGTGASNVRGQLPGMYYAAYNDEAYVNGVEKNDFIGYSGKNFVGYKLGNNGPSALVFFDLDGPWR